MAARLADPGYALQDIHDDCVALFPELQLYLLEEPKDTATVTARSSDEEYQRTGCCFVLKQLDTCLDSINTLLGSWG